ncbi:MAG: PAS domain S-box protein [Candidatus Kapabacteria bacterium]|nr:PAS domain S-box protein [Candidatus Kapabacteria bacterium]
MNEQLNTVLKYYSTKKEAENKYEIILIGFNEDGFIRITKNLNKSLFNITNADESYIIRNSHILNQFEIAIVNYDIEFDILDKIVSILNFIGLNFILYSKVYTREFILAKLEYNALDCFLDTSENFDNELIEKILENSLSIIEKRRKLNTLENQHHEIKEKYQVLFQNSVDAVYYSLVDGTIIDFNKSFEKLLGYSRDELFNINSVDLYKDPSHRVLFQAEIAVNGYVKDFEVELKKKNGETIIALLNSIEIKSAQGQTIGYQGIIDDFTERKKAETALRESELLYRTVVENIKEAIYITKSNIIIFSNSVASEITGYSKEELFGMNILNIIHPDDKHKLKLYLQTGILRSPDYNPFEIRIIKKSGLIRFVEFSNHVIKLNGFQVILGTARDITEIKKANELIKENERKLKTLISNLPGMAYRCLNDRHWTMQFISDGCYEITGYHSSEIVGNKKISYNDLILPDDRQYVWDTIQKAIQDGSSYTLSYRILSKNKEIKWLWERGRAIFDEENNQVLALEGFISDITYMREKEKALQISEAKYRNLFNMMLEGLILCEIIFEDDGTYDFAFVDINPTAEKFLNISKKDIIGKKASQVYDKFQGFDKIAYDVAINGKNYFLEEVKFSDEAYFDLSFFSPEKNKCAVILSDVSDRVVAKHKLENMNQILEEKVKERTHQLQQAYEELTFENEERKRTELELLAIKDNLSLALDKEKELNELKSSFINMVSHEYRTPLTIINSSVHLIEEYIKRSSYDSLDKHLTKIKTSVKSLVNLLENVVTISKSEAGKIKFSPEKFDLFELFDEIFEDLKIIYNSNHTFEIINDKNIKFIFTDKLLLKKILFNLLSNAVKYSPNNNLITIELSAQNDIMGIKIIDRGIGIPDEDQLNLFEPFYRSKNVELYPGTGLGLAIVKSCLNAINGTIYVKSKINEGSEFTIMFINNDKINGKNIIN